MSKKDKDMVATDEDFILLKRFAYSLAQFMERYPDGCTNDAVIANALGKTEEEIEEMYNAIVVKLRKHMKAT